MPDVDWLMSRGKMVLGAGDLAFPRRSLDELIDDIRQFHRESALAVLLRFNLALTHLSPLTQEELLRQWLPELAEYVIAEMRRQNAVAIFHEGQVLNLIRLVLLHAPTDGRRRCTHQRDF